MSLVRYVRTSKGVEIPLRFGQMVFVNLADAEGLTIDQVRQLTNNMKDWPVGRFYRLIYYAMKEGARKAGVSFEDEFEDVVDLIEEEPDLVKSIMDVYADGQIPAKKKTAKKVSRKAVKRVKR